MSTNESGSSRRNDRDRRTSEGGRRRTPAVEKDTSRRLHFRKSSKIGQRKHVNTSKRKTVLHDAITKGDVDWVRSLLAAGASPNEVDDNRDTPLLLAAKSDRIDIVQQVIDAGSTVNANDSRGNTSLHHAVMKKNVEMVKLLLSAGALPNVTNDSGESPLLLAFRRRDVDYDDVFLLCLKTRCRCGTLHPELVQEDFDIIQLLLKAGASPNTVAKQGDTPFLVTIRSEQIQLVQHFLDAGAGVNYITRVQNTHHEPKSPLHEAVHVCNVEILKLLLEHGADPNRANRLYYSVLFKASVANRNKIAMLNLLLDHGVDIYNGTWDLSGQENHGYLPFEYKLRSNDVEVVRLFLERGYDLSRFQPRDDDNPTPLHEAVSYRDICEDSDFNNGTSMLELLLDHYEAKGSLPIELEREDGFGRTPLFNTIDDKFDHAGLLLEVGADPNHEDAYGITPLDFTLFGGKCSYRFVRLLIDFGAELQNILERLVHDAKSERNRRNESSSDESSDFHHFRGAGRRSEEKAVESDSSTSDSDDSGNPDEEDVPMAPARQYREQLFPRRAKNAMKKAFRVVKYRTLYESQFRVKDPIRKKIKKLAPLRNYFKACKAEIAFLQDHQFDESVTYYDVLVDEDFWRRVKSSEAFEDFRNKVLPDSDRNPGNIQIYRDEIEECWEIAYGRYELWTSAAKGLEYLLGFNKDSYHLIFSNILDRLDDDDLQNLGEIDKVTD